MPVDGLQVGKDKGETIGDYQDELLLMENQKGKNQNKIKINGFINDDFFYQ